MQAARVLPTFQGTPLPTSTLLFKIQHNETLSRTDYPSVRFWMKGDWIDWLNRHMQPPSNKKTRARSDINQSLRYVETEHGVVVSGSRVTEMVRFAHSLWSQLAQTVDAPKSWGAVDTDIASNYQREMRLCYG